ncbi:MAG TPA: AzlC family ABC transporter permease [Pseudonocardia sp.]|nr:AzlC family ABC transporter permease [Pseudonocardia sp.]
MMFSQVRVGIGRWWSPVVRDGLGIGVATGTYGLSFGALSAAAGLSVAQTGALSLLMFTGASQLAFVGVLAAGGGPIAAVATATLLGSRNGLYGLQLSRTLGLRGWRRRLGAHLVIDESAAMAVRQADPDTARTAFWVTGLAVFVCWNTATLLGAVAARSLTDPAAFGLDVVGPAAFLALLVPRLRAQGQPRAWAAALLAGATALVATPFVPAGVPVLLAAVPAVALALAPSRPPRAGGSEVTVAGEAGAQVDGADVAGVGVAGAHVVGVDVAGAGADSAGAGAPGAGAGVVRSECGR